MWTRTLLKEQAKLRLDKKFWKAFLVCFVLGIIGVSMHETALSVLEPASNVLGASLGVSSLQASLSKILSYSSNPLLEIISNPLLEMISRLLWNGGIAILIVVFVFMLCRQFFLFNPLNVGAKRFFMENRLSNAPVRSVWSVFDRNYLNIVKVEMWVQLKILLGIVLLIVPGVYWAYCYRLVPYVLAENPQLTAKRAMELSKQMMQDEKKDSFVLELSFLGWYLLGMMLPLGLGTLLVNPYYQATWAEFYEAMRTKAFELNLTNANELAGFASYPHDS